MTALRDDTVAHGPAVLCIDDHASGLATRKLLLESNGFRVFTAENGPTGLELVSRGRIEAVILDYKMPEMDGGTVAKELRSAHPRVPILLLSGFASEIPKSVLSMVDGFVVKGSSPEILIKELERIIGTKSGKPLMMSKSIESSAEIMEHSREAIQRSQQLLQRSHPKRAG